MYFSKVLIVAALFIIIECKKLPSYIKPCKRDAQFTECAKEHAKEAIANLIKGDKKFKVPNMQPFRLDSIELRASKDFTIGLKTVSVYGLETAILEDYKLDMEKRNIRAIVNLKNIKILGTYKMDGKLFLIEMHGDGPAEILFGDVTVNYSMDFDFKTKKDGKRYIDTKSVQTKVDFEVKKWHHNYQNLFNGNKLLGDETNKFLNENGALLIKEMSPSISEIVKVIVSSTVNEFLNVIPVDEIFIPEL